MRSSHLLGRNTVSVQHITPQTKKAKVPHEASLPHITETTLRYVHFTIFYIFTTATYELILVITSQLPTKQRQLV